MFNQLKFMIDDNAGGRFERKYHTDQMPVWQIEELMKIHPCLFHKIYDQRHVNNIYLDEWNYRSFLDNIQGVNERHKVRIRWYGDPRGRVDQPVLEVKLRINDGGFKLRFPVKSFNMGESFSGSDLHQVITSSDLPDVIRELAKRLTPSLFNRYLRRYFLSADKNFRVTLDDQLEYCRLFACRNHFLTRKKDHRGKVIECKYRLSAADRVQDIVRFWPFRLSRMSKYVTGIQELNLCGG